MGDRLLQITGEILQKVTASSEIVARMGGDEFVVLLPRGGPRRTEEVMESVRKEVSQVVLDSVIFSLAMGYAVKKQEEQNLGEILVEAENAMYKDKLKYGKIMRSQTVERVLSHINIRYDREQIHTERVAEYCEALARALEYEESQVEMVKTAAVLHDIGKIMVPLELLNKEEPLSKEEFDIIKRHPQTGYEILKSVEEYAGLAEYVLYHHERFDGKGYPEGLQGEAIPLVARIICVADAYEAMTASRPYQKARSREEAMAELERCAGTQFDPHLVSVFLEKVLQKAES
jgi:putative nucleotidyltransferase with HDIG domain